MSKDINVLIVDDHEFLRNGLAQYLKDCDGIHVVGTAANGEEALTQCTQLHPDIVLMDQKMPRMDGITATRLIREQYPTIQVVLLTAEPYAVTEKEVLAAGVSRILPKAITVSEIAQALRDTYADSHTS